MLHILVIEDDADFSAMVTRFLELKGHIVQAAYNGESGLRLAKEGNFDAIVCDLGLPDMDGFEVAAQIRRQTEQPWVVVIALTDYGKIDGRRHAIRAGFDDYLLKPIHLETLAVAITNAIREVN
jgi:DNA-binding response OmpR family regulator